jgi:exonuclease VII large subunit
MLNRISELKKEKRKIQKMLLDYQKNFVKKNERPIETAKDKLPVQTQMTRYKELKSQLEMLEKRLKFSKRV